MKKYLRNEIIIKKGTYITQIFQIKTGHIQTKRENKQFSPNDYLFLDQIFTNSYSNDDYIALDQVTGEWINKDQIDMSYFFKLSQMIQEKENHITLLLIKDPITRLARYLYYEAINNQTLSFYLTFTMSSLSSYLNIAKPVLSKGLQFLKNQNIISKHNQLFNILNLTLLEKIAYRKD